MRSATSSPRSSARSPQRSSSSSCRARAVAAGITQPGGGVSDIGALIIEFFMTAGFVLVILVCLQRAAALAALAIPLTLVAIHFACATLSGASVNPAGRSARRSSAAT